MDLNVTDINYAWNKYNTAVPVVGFYTKYIAIFAFVSLEIKNRAIYEAFVVFIYNHFICPHSYARGGSEVAVAIIECEHMPEALSTILDSAPPALGPSGQDSVSLARYEARPLALKLLRLLCQASAGSAQVVQRTGAVTPGICEGE